MHEPDWQVSEPLQTVASLHAEPFGLAGFEQTPVDVLHVPTSWQESDAVQTMGFAPAQVPVWQVSVWVQALESLHAVPFAFSGFAQMPVEGSQVPALWHWSLAVQTTGFAPVQVPVWQVSVWVQAFASLQAVPLVLGGFEQTPVAGLQVPASWHWSLAVQVTGVPATQVLLTQVSMPLQGLPSSQLVPQPLPAADGGVHVGDDLRGGEAVVVDADVVDAAFEPFAPDGVAADADGFVGRADVAVLLDASWRATPFT